ncbi:atherin-like [Panicum virgatum]|uniref:atherin-like n=1 Tax=Panicum virgatum TaxID=38727 RepID=UPI0019D65227|nr:atherin-like [Panicum virgatum]
MNASSEGDDAPAARGSRTAASTATLSDQARTWARPASAARVTPPHVEAIADRSRRHKHQQPSLTALTTATGAATPPWAPPPALRAPAPAARAPVPCSQRLAAAAATAIGRIPARCTRAAAPVPLPGHGRPEPERQRPKRTPRPACLRAPASSPASGHRIRPWRPQRRPWRRATGSSHGGPRSGRRSHQQRHRLSGGELPAAPPVAAPVR